jgi:hypothetical protein
MRILQLRPTAESALDDPVSGHETWVLPCGTGGNWMIFTGTNLGSWDSLYLILMLPNATGICHFSMYYGVWRKLHVDMDPNTREKGRRGMFISNYWVAVGDLSHGSGLVTIPECVHIKFDLILIICVSTHKLVISGYSDCFFLLGDRDCLFSFFFLITSRS